MHDKTTLNPALLAHALEYYPIHERMQTDEAFIPRSDPFFQLPAVEYIRPGCIRLNYFAPGARQVEVCGWEAEGSFEKKRPLHRSLYAGYWIIELDDLPAGFHYCTFFEDGRSRINPLGPIGYGADTAANFIEVPDESSNFYLLQDVPHGTVHMNLYPSANAPGNRMCYVYTPPQYEYTQYRYPTVYIQHGGGETETAWLWQGKINLILDNLIAASLCEPMIAVLNSGYAYEIHGDEVRMGSFSRVLAQECVPFIDHLYRTIPDRKHRAVCGLSLGGLHAKQAVFENMALFANLGVFSSGAGFDVKGTDVFGNAYDYSQLFDTPERYNQRLDITFVSCGDQDRRIAYTKPQVQKLQQLGYAITFASYPGFHEWQVWRKSARDFLQLIFRNTGKQ